MPARSTRHLLELLQFGVNTTPSSTDTVAFSESAPQIALAASDTAAFTETASLVTITVVAVTSSDGGTLTDDIPAQGVGDEDFVILIDESGAVATLTPTGVSSTDSAALSETGTVGTAAVTVSTDTATVSDTGTVVTLTDTVVTYTDTLAFTDAYQLLVLVASSDGGTLTEGDGVTGSGGGIVPHLTRYRFR